VAEAWAIIYEHHLAPYTYWYDHPPLGWAQLAGYIWLTDGFARYSSSIEVGREFMLLVAVASSILVYVLCLRLRFRPATAGITVALFGLSPLAVYYHRLVSLDNIGTLWLLAAMVAVGIAIEFCPIYFGTEVLTSTGLRTAQAATAMSGFYLGILLSRIGGAYLIRRAGRTVPLLWVSLAVTTAGFGMFWLADQPALAIAGLTVCGAGLANLYPLSLALTLAAAPGNGDTANARIQLLGGILVVAAPYLLGSLADHLGLRHVGRRVAHPARHAVLVEGHQGRVPEAEQSQFIPVRPDHQVDTGDVRQ